MSLLVGLLEIYTPEYIKKRALRELFSCTAAAFEAEVPLLTDLSSQECLAQYARFTQAQAEQRLRSGRGDASSQLVLDACESCESVDSHDSPPSSDSPRRATVGEITTQFASCDDASEIEALEQRLHRNAFEMGRRYGKWLRLGTVQDVMAIGRVLYRILDIDLQGDARGEVVINRCYFSRFYSPEVCRLMSAMDCGLFAGLSNGGELAFTSRITEGQPCCRAHFSWEPKAGNHLAAKT